MYHRLVKMSDNRITKRVLLWDINITDLNPNINTWSKEVKQVLSENNLLGTFSLNPFNLRLILDNLKSCLILKDQEKLFSQCQTSSKLRTYCLLTGDPGLRNYLARPLSFLQRKHMAKIRLVVLPLRVETGRYEIPRVEYSLRLCKQCALSEVENEEHFLLRCTKHNTRRVALLSELNLANWDQWDSKQKIVYLLNNPSSLRATARFIVESYNARSIN